MTGITSSGVPVSCSGTIIVRQSIIVEMDTLTIGDTCNFTNVRIRGDTWSPF